VTSRDRVVTPCQPQTGVRVDQHAPAQTGRGACDDDLYWARCDCGHVISARAWDRVLAAGSEHHGYVMRWRR
jgi:hypothetical protein